MRQSVKVFILLVGLTVSGTVASTSFIFYAWHTRAASDKAISENVREMIAAAELDVGYAMGHDKSRYFWSGRYVNIDLNYDSQLEVSDLEIRAKPLIFGKPENETSQKVENAVPGM